MKLTLFIAIGTGILAILPFAQAKDRLLIDSVEGDRSVVIFTDQTARPAKQGEEVQYWDVIQTSRLSAVKLRYPDGSLVVVGRDTKFTIQPRLEGTQYNRLDWGQVRAQVTPTTDPNPKAPPRFVIRTRSATMGVRGTDFVAGFDAQTGLASLHTIEGTVDMAGDESKVMTWKGTPVTAGHEASLSTSSSGVTLGDFAPLAYKEKIKTDQPELVALADRPADGTEPPLPTSAATAPEPLKQELSKSNDEPRLSLLRFRVGAVSLLQNTGQSTGIQYTTVSPSWNPSFRIWSPLSLIGNLAGFLVKNGTTGASIPAIKGGLFLDLKTFGGFHLEAGPGVELWKTDTAGAITTPYFMANVVWEFAPGKWLDSIYAGYSNQISHQFGYGSPSEMAAGIGLRF